MRRGLGMAKDKSELLNVLENLKQQRDELMLQLHLGKAEAQDELAALEKKWEEIKHDLEGSVEGSLQAEWDKLEKRWEELTEKADPVKETVEDISEDVGAAVELVGEELKRGYERLMKLF
jgi:hypothetical protein